MQQECMVQFRRERGSEPVATRQRKMKLRQLESWLQQANGFADPKMELEQYATSPQIAAHMLYTMEQSYGDVEDKAVADLGCGCGVLGIGAVMLGASYVVGFDTDPDALAIATANCEELEAEIDFVRCNFIENPPFKDGSVDTVVMNPPFGTKKGSAGIDMVFLQRGLKMARTAVYSLHKTSTREYIGKQAAKWGAKMEVVAELRYNLPATYKVHKKKSVDIKVDFLRFTHIQREGGD